MPSFFGSGSADVKPEIRGVLEKLSQLLLTAPGKVTIEGHSDNIPIASAKYASNWELSTAQGSKHASFFY